ncbi:RagB/SusD family nutrient uptake outer membrane protein [Pseudoflavitalea rhizosphaerae]|uniref:RagB/SusD family nutrient uptake outer membrane protein n=1 Tax=Pseudoflavitalea rhizosphaerae TaxID=1884793 RepID=UPI000F8ED48B|nr:RagB/SusD family nutrient uptake outer membrane protein [Pseudoflavitalea rhizosphaerae]
MKIVKYLLLASVLAIVVSGCQKLLDVPETDVIAGDVALKTVANNEQGVIGAYAALGVEMNILLNATFSDEVKTVGEFYNAATTHEWQYSSQDVGIRDNFTAMGPNYQIVDRVNRVLAALPTADSTRTGDEKLRSRLRGEALFLRAYAHFELFRYYCEKYTPGGLAMPYLEKSILEPVARIDMATYFSKLNADISEAKGLLPNNLSDKFRANVASAHALHARIALYQGDWPTAESNATAYINLLPLASRADFPKIWTDEITDEVSFQLLRNPQVGPRMGSLFRGISSVVNGNIQLGTIVWGVSDKLWNSYDADDIRFDAYVIDEPLLADNGRPSKIVKKYAGGAYTTATENFTNGKVFRTGEMYLIRAEARAEQNKFSGANSAESDLNELGAMRISGYTPISLGSKDEAITAVMNERFIELPFEGHRFFDLKRRGLPVQRNASDAPTTSSATLEAGNFRFVLPIPQRELEANVLMEQNQGY